MTDPDFLARLHEQFTAPRPLVIGLIEGATDQGIRDLQRVKAASARRRGRWNKRAPWEFRSLTF